MMTWCLIGYRNRIDTMQPKPNKQFCRKRKSKSLPLSPFYEDRTARSDGLVSWRWLSPLLAADSRGVHKLRTNYHMYTRTYDAMFKVFHMCP